jgi:choline-sulfatase
MTAHSRRSFLSGMCAAVPLAARARPRTPNILFILTDDQGYWTLGKAGNGDAHTPNLDRLAAEGAYFTNSFVTTPVCSPSRAATMTSRYGSEVGVTDFLSPAAEDAERGVSARFPMWPEALRAAGYRTGIVGKWHLGRKPEFLPARRGYEYVATFSTDEGTGPADPEFLVQGETRKFQGCTADIATDYAADFIRQHRGEPFLLSLHYREPHASNAPDLKGKDRTWLPIPEEDWGPFRTRDVKIPNPDYPDLDLPRVTRMMREYLASVTSVDRNVGRLLRLLGELGLERDTVVIFTSDNGMNMGHHGVWHKGNAWWILKHNRDPRPNLWDYALRVPALVRWPGRIRAGTVIGETLTNLDWFRTVLAMAGVSEPKGALLRGRNALPLLEGRRVSWDNDLYTEYDMYHGTRAELCSIRTPEWKLVRDFRNPARDELYHLETDPGEAVNRIGSPDAAVQKMRKQLDAALERRRRELQAGAERGTP